MYNLGTSDQKANRGSSGKGCVPLFTAAVDLQRQSAERREHNGRE